MQTSVRNLLSFFQNIHLQNQKSKRPQDSGFPAGDSGSGGSEKRPHPVTSTKLHHLRGSPSQLECAGDPHTQVCSRKKITWIDNANANERCPCQVGAPWLPMCPRPGTQSSSTQATAPSCNHLPDRTRPGYYPPYLEYSRNSIKLFPTLDANRKKQIAFCFSFSL